MGKDRTYTDFSGTWITKDGWCRREQNGRPSYIYCSCCEAPVDRVHDDSGMCQECISIELEYNKEQERGREV